MHRPHAPIILTLFMALGCSPDHPAAPSGEARATQPSPEEALPGASTSVNQDERLVTIWIRPKPGSPTDVRADLVAAGAEFVSRARGLDPIAVDVRGQALEAVLGKRWVEVVAIDSSGGDRPMGTRAYSLAGAMTGLITQTTSWSVHWVGAPVAHSRGFSGAGVTIGIIDDGLYCYHSDLSGAVVASYDFAGNQPVCVNGSHGTQVAGVLGARNNSIDLLGVAPNSSLYNLRICNLGDCSRGRLYDALGYAIDAGIDILNYSLGDCGGNPPSAPLATRLAVYAGVGGLFFASGGNGTAAGCDPGDDVSSIAAASHTIAVGAHTSTGQYVPEFQYGPEIDFSAPTNTQSLWYQGGVTGLYDFGGTSAATPHAAAAAAALLSAGFPADKVYQRLKDSAVNPAGSAHTYVYGWGRIDLAVGAAVKPRVDAVSWCTGTGITTAGSCWFRADWSWGAPPVGFLFEFSRSDQPGVTMVGWGADSISYSVPSGDYTLSVKVTPRDNSYNRVGFYAIQEIPVCTTGGAALLDPVVQTAAATCGGGGEQ